MNSVKKNECVKGFKYHASSSNTLYKAKKLNEVIARGIEGKASQEYFFAKVDAKKESSEHICTGTYLNCKEAILEQYALEAFAYLSEGTASTLNQCYHD